MRQYDLLPVDIAETVFEPPVGGHVYDPGVDGSVSRWVRVPAFEPPDRFVISRDINSGWELETDPDKASEVAIGFVALAPSGPK